MIEVDWETTLGLLFVILAFFYGIMARPSPHMALVTHPRQVLVDQASRGLTKLVDLDAWFQICGDNDQLLVVLAGAVWFRFHVRGDWIGTLPKERPVTVLGLIQWALGPQSSQTTAGMCEIMTLWREIGCQQLPVAAVDAMTEEILVAVGEAGDEPLDRQAQRLRGYLVLLHVWHVDEESVTQSISVPSTTNSGWHLPLLQRLQQLVLDDRSQHELAHHLVRFCLRLRRYPQAVELLQSPEQCRCRLRQPSIDAAVAAWLVDRKDTCNAMKQGLLNISTPTTTDCLVVMGKTVLEQVKETEDGLNAARALSRIGTALIDHGWIELGLKCLEQAWAVTEQCLVPALEGVAQRLYYAGVILGVKKRPGLSMQCLSAHVRLKNQLEPQTLSDILQQLEPQLARLDETDIGLAFVRKELGHEVARAGHVCALLANLLNTLEPGSSEAWSRAVDLRMIAARCESCV